MVSSNCFKSNHNMMIMDCFCGMVYRRKAFRGHLLEGTTIAKTYDTPGAGFELVQNLSSGFAE